MYAKHGNLVESSTKHIESRLEVIQGHAFWDHWKADEGGPLDYWYKNVGFRVGNFEV